LAVFVEPFLSFLLEGRKTIESRFSVNRCAPYHSVKAGDLVVIKMSGGPIVAVAEVSRVWFYELDEKGLDIIRTRFGRQLCIDDPEFWERKAAACYGTLMQFAWIKAVEPVPCLKRDRRGWVVLEQSEQQSLFKNKEVASRA